MVGNVVECDISNIFHRLIIEIADEQFVCVKSMNNFRILFLVTMCVTQIMGCSEDKVAANKAKKASMPIPWWEYVQPIIIDGDEFYGRSCSVTRVSSNNAGIKSGRVIFNVPSRLFTSCAKSEPNRNYLEYDGEYIILHVDRQTFGAGSWTGELYRSSDFKSWEEYIGVTWINSEEYEAWRKVGSTSSKADSRKKVVRE